MDGGKKERSKKRMNLNGQQHCACHSFYIRAYLTTIYNTKRENLLDDARR